MWHRILKYNHLRQFTKTLQVIFFSLRVLGLEPGEQLSVIKLISSFFFFYFQNQECKNIRTEGCLSDIYFKKNRPVEGQSESRSYLD